MLGLRRETVPFPHDHFVQERPGRRGQQEGDRRSVANRCRRSSTGGCGPQSLDEAKAAFSLGNGRVHRPWVTEPGMWLQYDFGDGPVIAGRKTVLFCAWLAWSRFRVVLALRDRTAPTVFAALDVMLRRLGGAPTYVLTDNEKTVTVTHIAGMAVRNPQIVSFAAHYGVTVHTCEPADPASKGGSENTVKLAKADLVPTETNLLGAYDSFADLEAACRVFCDMVNARVHRVTRRAPNEMLATNKPGCTRCPRARTRSRSGWPAPSRPAARWCPWTAGSTPSRTPSAGRACGSASTARAPTNR